MTQLSLALFDKPMHDKDNTVHLFIDVFVYLFVGQFKDVVWTAMLISVQLYMLWWKLKPLLLTTWKEVKCRIIIQLFRFYPKLLQNHPFMYAVVQLVEPLLYSPEGPWFCSRWVL